MSRLQQLIETYGRADYRDMGSRQLEALRDGLKEVQPEEIKSASDGKSYIYLLRMFREAVAENDKLHGENYPQLLNSLLSVGEDGVYSNNLRFVFELIQNVDDCDFPNPADCKLDMRFDFSKGEIVLTYNEVGFTPFNVFAITGIAEAAKNISASKNEIGEKGIGFKSVFGVADRVLIRSGWFSFELYKNDFTIPVASYQNNAFCPGTEMTLFVAGKAQLIYRQIKERYCKKEALFQQNPLLFLNKLTSLKLYYDTWRSMEFGVSRTEIPDADEIYREDNVRISVNLRDHENGADYETVEEITCVRYIYPITYDHAACRSRYGEKTELGAQGGKRMLLQAVFPYIKDVDKVGAGGLYSFLPTLLAFTVPVVCHAPFKLDASREFVDPQGTDNGEGNIWFQKTAKHLSALLDYAYLDWRTIVKQSIVFYLPPANGSLFANNNGKEKCLSSYDSFKGQHFLKLPLFFTANSDYKPATDVFYFDPAENVTEPEKVFKLLMLQKSLFLAPQDISVGRFGISIERDVNNRLFKRALYSESAVEIILNYLDSVDYEYTDRQIPRNEVLGLSIIQMQCFMKHPRVAEILQKNANEAIRRNQRPFFALSGMHEAKLSDTIPEGLELEDTPTTVGKYMTYCGGTCFCLDIPKDCYFPCNNGIVLSKNDPLASFVAFCFEMDPLDTFAIRCRLREASNMLNQCVESNSGTASDFLRDLANIRKTVQESLGKTQYKSFIELIMRSGTDKNRFIQELLQNADDCTYPEGCVPTFTLHQRSGMITTEYNEIGFTRANIRSITAIGESTKNRLLMGDLHTIGEKGVGFKTVFATASEVRIYSGEYNFALTAEAPTIPKSIRTPAQIVNGTRIEITLKEHTSLPLLKEKDVLELCLCLRQLKRIKINELSISIEDSDTDNTRTISVNKRSYTFRRYIHVFKVESKEALRERENGTKRISPEQQIACYVPEKPASTTDYPLYVGLPTRHRMRIPMAIDAPFELTTSREEIELDRYAWNGLIRQAVYDAIIQVIHARKREDRVSVLRFARTAHQRAGLQDVYVNDISDSQFINDYDYLDRLRKERILPTIDLETFAAASEKNAYRFPEAATILMKALPNGSYGAIKPETVLETDAPGVSKEQKERIEAVINALNCENADFYKVFPLLEEYAEEFVSEDAFRESLYAYLQETPPSYQDRVSALKILPVYGVHGGVTYTPWIEDGIFVKKGTFASTDSYWVLNEALLSKSMCEKMLGVNINEMNTAWEHNKYNEQLRTIVRGNHLTRIYDYLVNEFRLGNLEKNGSFETLYALKNDGLIPLKNQLDEIVDTELFLCDQPEGYFPVKMLQRLIVNKECEAFARFLRSRELCGIHYEDLDYNECLNDDDIEMLEDSYFRNSDEIIRGFYFNDQIPDELLEKNGLLYLTVGHTNENNTNYCFPTNPLVNRAILADHIQKQWQNPIRIVSVIEERTVHKGEEKDGQRFGLDIRDARDGALRIYSPEGVHGRCFCQMCHAVKPIGLIEVNNIEYLPQFFFPQMRIALCLDCSKRFEALRGNISIRERFLNTIKGTVILDQGTVDVPIGEEQITFTATHLAEIQEILKLIPKT